MPERGLAAFVLRLLGNAAALWLAARMVSGVVFTGDGMGLLAVALVFTIVNAVIKPVTKVFTFPLILLSLGFFLLVINALMLELTSALAGWLRLGFHVRGFGAAFLGGLVITLVNGLVWLIAREGKRV